MIESGLNMRQRLQVAYTAYDKALRAHKVNQREAQRQKDMDETAERERRIYSGLKRRLG